jgi:hypothetical protein
MLRWLLFVLWPTVLLAVGPIDIETNPREPIKGEVFQLLFKCQTESNVVPEITFEPVGFEVLGKQVQGLSTRTVFKQGKYTTTREILVSYDARATRSGTASLRNVAVKIDGQIERSDSLTFKIVDAPAEPKLVFVAADVSKKSVFVGEGIIVRYHVLAKTGLQAADIKKYPKLDGFMKRYLQESENPHRVTIDGDQYRKSLIYSVRLYPERAGKLIIDPMEISATYAQDVYGNMGFGFGLGMRDMKTKLMSSEPVEIDVKPLPEANRPASFTGLVGVHKFELKPGRSQILVNEPLEVRLTVNGPGSLETFEAPPLWTVPQLEKFDAKADLSLVGGESAIKTFDYTYLGKLGGEIPAFRLELSYFDPETHRYEKFVEELPAITVAGNANPDVQTPVTAKTQEIDDEAATPVSNPGFILENRWWSQMGMWWALLIVATLAGAYWKRQVLLETVFRARAPVDNDLKKLANGQFAVAELVRVLYRLSPESPSVRQALLSSTLGDEEKQYFANLLSQMENAEFMRSSTSKVVRVSPKMLRELRKSLKG